MLINDCFPGQFEKAIEHYETAGTHNFEVPRMLFDDLTQLERYVLRKDDKYDFIVFFKLLATLFKTPNFCDLPFL